MFTKVFIVVILMGSYSCSVRAAEPTQNELLDTYCEQVGRIAYLMTPLLIQSKWNADIIIKDLDKEGIKQPTNPMSIGLNKIATFLSRHKMYDPDQAMMVVTIECLADYRYFTFGKIK